MIDVPQLSGDSSKSPGEGQTAAVPAVATVEYSAMSRRRGWLATLLVFALTLAALVPTTGDFGLTWDEPAYAYSQNMSAQWWAQLIAARSWPELRALLNADTLLYYWPYGRFGINFHPPLAGQLNLAAHQVFGSWMKDVPSRRMASVIEFALTLTIGFHFLARRYGTNVGLVMAGSLLLMPRLYGQAHLIDTDIPGLLLWAAAAIAFWNGLRADGGRPCACSWESCLAWRSSRSWPRSAPSCPSWSGWRSGTCPNRSAVKMPGQLDRRRDHIGPDAPTAGTGFPGNSEPPAATAHSGPDRPVRGSAPE